MRIKALAGAHISVFLFSLSGVIAKWVSLSSTELTSARSLIGGLCLFFLILFRKSLFQKELTRSNFQSLLLAGILLAFHWICFYQSIKVSSVSIGVAAVSTFPIMTALLESGLERRWPKKHILFSSLLVIVGSFVLLGRVPDTRDQEGMLWGLLSAFLFVLIHLNNKRLVSQLSGSKLVMIQLLVAGLLLLPVSLNGFKTMAEDNDILIIVLFLGFFCTAMAYVLFIGSMRRLSASSAAILTGLEPVYAILLAYVFLHETIELNKIIGIGIILVAVVMSALWTSKERLDC